MRRRTLYTSGIFGGVLLSPLVFNHTAMASFTDDYGDHADANVNYLQTTETSATASNALYGSPTYSGNAVSFHPSSFFSSSSSGGGTDTVQGDLTTTVVGDTGTLIHSLSFAEGGDYTLEGTGTSATNVSVTAPVIITITQVNGVAVTPIVDVTNLTFTPSSSYSLPTDEGAGVIYNGGLSVNLDALVLGAGDTGSATEVEWDLDNTLVANSESGTVALIAKKSVEGDVSVSAVVTTPEPGSAGVAFGVTTLLLRRRRQSNV